MKEKILIIGETCFDVFIYGDSNRLAPEAPAPVFVPIKEEKNLGMAGNVFENIRSLEVPVDIMTNSNFKDVTKTRYVHASTNSLLLRVDSGEEKIQPFNYAQLRDIKDYGAVLISDYCKGFLSEEAIQEISKKHPRVFLDTKKRLGDWCKEVFLIKVNSIEFNSSDIDNLDEDIQKKIIHTAGPQGCFYKGERFPVKKVDIKDLSGAGDTFFATLAVHYIKSGSVRDSIKFANECATLAVQHRGVFQGA